MGVLFESAIEIYRHRWDAGATAIHHLRLPRPKVQALERTEARRSLGLCDSQLVGMAGRISFKQKGHDTFVDAAEISSGASQSSGLRWRAKVAIDLAWSDSSRIVDFASTLIWSAT